MVTLLELQQNLVHSEAFAFLPRSLSQLRLILRTFDDLDFTRCRTKWPLFNIPIWIIKRLHLLWRHGVALPNSRMLVNVLTKLDLKPVFRKLGLFLVVEGVLLILQSLSTRAEPAILNSHLEGAPRLLLVHRWVSQRMCNRSLNHRLINVLRSKFRRTLFWAIRNREV